MFHISHAQRNATQALASHSEPGKLSDGLTHSYSNYVYNYYMYIMYMYVLCVASIL